MCVLRGTFIILTFVFSVTPQVPFCRYVSFNNIQMQVYYSQGNFVYSTANEKNVQSTDTKTLTVNGCISPFTTLLIDKTHSIETMQQLVIKDQMIPVLYEEAVVGFPTIWSINLQNNKITAIRRGAFKNLRQLEIIHLTGNDIQYMDDNVFIGLPNLHSLFMENNNLKTFEKEWVGNLPQLYVLSLAQNKLENIPRALFITLGSLRILDLSHNEILSVQDKGFEGLRFLEFLDLGYNRISRIQKNLFAPTTGLRVLNMYYNNLTYILPDALESLSHLEDLIVLSNPLTCECYDQIFQWATSKGVEMKNSYLKCKKTDNVENIPVCVTTDDKQCVTDYSKEDLFSILHDKPFDYECMLQSAVIKLIYD